MDTEAGGAEPQELRVPEDVAVVDVNAGDRLMFVVDEGLEPADVLAFNEQVNRALNGGERLLVAQIRGVVVLRAGSEAAAPDPAPHARAHASDDRGAKGWFTTTCLLHNRVGCLECADREARDR